MQNIMFVKRDNREEKVSFDKITQWTYRSPLFIIQPEFNEN